MIDGLTLSLNLNPERSKDFQLFTKAIYDLVYLEPIHTKNSHQNTLKIGAYTQKISAKYGRQRRHKIGQAVILILA